MMQHKVYTHKFTVSVSRVFTFSLSVIVEMVKGSRNERLLCVPTTKQKSFGDRAFSEAWLTFWNALPLDTRL